MTTVLFLSNGPPHAPPGANALGPDTGLLARGLERAGLHVRGRALNGPPLNPLRRAGTFYAGFDVARALTVMAADRDVDVIVSIGESNVALILALARLTGFRPRIALREISPRGWRRRDRIVDYVLPRVDRVLALTPHQKDWTEATFRLKSPVDMVGFAVDETFFSPSGAPDAGYVLAVGDDFGRDYRCLYDACASLECPLVLRVDRPPPVPAELQRRVRLVQRGSFQDLRTLYDAAAVVVVPLLQVDHPSGITALFEAMAMGRAVVASRMGSTAHIVRSGENGLLVPPGDAAAMRDAIALLLADAGLRRRLGEEARRTIEGAFSYAAYVARFAASLHATAAQATPLERGAWHGTCSPRP